MARVPKPSGNQKRDKKRERGKSGKRGLRPRLLIVCEGEKTEKFYLESFRVTVKVDVIGKGRNRKSLVEHAREKRDYFANSDGEYTNVWAVFDLDHDAPTDPKDFNEAIELAYKIDIEPAYSNPSFELWYLLHYQPMMGNTSSRFQYLKMLSKKLGKEYDKTDATLYQDLLSSQPIALKNAENLMRKYKVKEKHHNPARDKPCTRVHTLVQELKKHER